MPPVNTTRRETGRAAREPDRPSLNLHRPHTDYTRPSFTVSPTRPDSPAPRHGAPTPSRRTTMRRPTATILGVAAGLLGLVLGGCNPAPNTAGNKPAPVGSPSVGG